MMILLAADRLFKAQLASWLKGHSARLVRR